MIQIAVIGSNEIQNEKNKLIAYELGVELAKNNFILVCGGHQGVMKYVAKGVKANNGLTIGILPENNTSFANKYIDVKIATGMGYARNIIIIKSVDIVVSIEGASGTLSEIAHAMNENKLVIVLENTGGISEFLAKNKDNFQQVNIAKSVQDTINMILEFYSKR